MGVKAMKDGAIDFLQKPVQEGKLLEAIGTALDKDMQLKKEQKEIDRIQQVDIDKRELRDKAKDIADGGGQTVDDTDKVHAIRGLHRSGPYAGREFREPLEEALAEHTINRVWW